MCHLIIDAFDLENKYKIKNKKSQVKEEEWFLQKSIEYLGMNLKTNNISTKN
jgi:hypothetical protein